MAEKPVVGNLTEREQHEMVTDAFGAIRLIRGHYASSKAGADRIREVVEMLLAAGKSHDMGKYGSILTTAADAICRTYLNTSVEDLQRGDRQAA